MRLLIELHMDELSLPIRSELALMIYIVELINLLPGDDADRALNLIPIDIYYRCLKQLEASRIIYFQRFIQHFNSCHYVEDVRRLRNNLYEVVLS